MTKKEKHAYQKTLLAQKEKIVKKLSQLNSESKEVETDIAQDVVDKAESSYTKEFGICQMCAKPIGMKRLGALPWTPYCIDCQQKKEEEKA